MSSKKPAASRAELGALHDEFAKKLKKYLAEGETIVQAGQTHQVSCSAAMLNVIRGFLKDNNVECVEGHPSAPVGTLTKQLKAIKPITFDEDEAPRFEN